jgi:hypothetical protein
LAARTLRPSAASARQSSVGWSGRLFFSKEPRSDPRFEHGKRARYAGLGLAQSLCALGQPAMFDDGSNDLKVARVKFHNLKVILMLANWIK